jgi:hypothetical protein
MHAVYRSERLERRALVARWFVSAVADTDATLKGIAKCAGVDEKKVHNVARANHGLTFDLALSFPDDVFDRVVGRLVNARGRGLYQLPEPTEDPVNVIDRFLCTKDSLTNLLVPCTRKRSLSAEEAAELEPKLRQLQADAQAILEKCAEARTRRGVILHDEETTP